MPHQKQVQFFATCLADLIFPEVAADAVALLEEAGYEVDFPNGQVCCGQPACNAGHIKAAARVARTFARAFSRRSPIVTPSGSCAAFVDAYLPDLLGCDPFPIYELSAFLESEAVALPARNSGRAVAYHTSCHMLRILGVPSAVPEQLLRDSGATLVDLPRPDLCCGFGGTFMVRQPEISLAMADEKLALPAPVDALVTADPGCLAHLRSRSAARSGPPLVHIATALQRGV